ncbi:hypothetical protein FIM04_04065 [SAR202 cluster bacterium AC-409-J13_OGT_754m]|nr:hypothetical protein [SAR202 cluster bacterium AC-409-J13_OGT_754m]
MGEQTVGEGLVFGLLFWLAGLTVLYLGTIANKNAKEKWELETGRRRPENVGDGPIILAVIVTLVLFMAGGGFMAAGIGGGFTFLMALGFWIPALVWITKLEKLPRDRDRK